MLLGSSNNGRLEVTRFSLPTTSGTVSVIRRDAKRNTLGLTAPGSLNTCPMCEKQRWVFNVPTMLLRYTGPPSLGLDPKDPAILGLKACWRLFVYLTQLGLDPQTTRLTVQASSNCPTLTPYLLLLSVLLTLKTTALGGLKNICSIMQQRVIPLYLIEARVTT